MFLMNWWLLSILTLLSVLAVVIACCIKARYSLRAEKKTYRALMELDPDNVDCDVECPRSRFLEEMRKRKR